jgi:5-formyltetrahydrofolate cyclo-ligase
MPPNSPDLTAEKKALRAVVLAERAKMAPAARPEGSRAILRQLLGLPEYRRAASVMTYMSFGEEVDTREFFNTALADAKTLLLPRIDRARRTLVVHGVARAEDLVPGVWGILEPHENLPVASVDDADFILMPGLAFDRAGNRLGYGAGYYDRLLSASKGAAWRVAAAFDCQVVDAVPAGANDQPIHALVTPTQLLRFPT